VDFLQSRRKYHVGLLGEEHQITGRIHKRKKENRNSSYLAKAGEVGPGVDVKVYPTGKNICRSTTRLLYRKKKEPSLEEKKQNV